MSNNKNVLLIDVYFFITLILTLALPLLLPEYPISYMETLIGFPHGTGGTEYLFFLILVILAMVDFVMILGIKKDKIISSATEKAKYLMMIGLADGCLIYGLLAELLVWLNVLSSCFTIIFLVIGFIGYILTKI